MNVPLLDLRPQLDSLRPQLLEALTRVLDSTGYILGPEVERFEADIAAYCGAKHAVGLSSGTDALLAALEKAESELASLLDRQSAMDDLSDRLSRARKSQALVADEATLCRNTSEIQKQRKELDEAVKALSVAESALPEAEARQHEAQSHTQEADDMLASAQKLSDCIPVLKDLEKNQKELEKRKKQVLALLDAGNQADHAYIAAKEGYYRSQAGLLAAELEAGRPCPVCGACAHPQPAKLTDEAVTKEDMEAADRRRRETADALHEAENARAALQARVDKDALRLREMNIPEGETQQRLNRRIGDLKSQAEQLRSAIEASRKACDALRIQIEKNRTAVGEGEKHFALLVETTNRLEQQFREKLAAAGFEDERAYQQAKLPERKMSDIEKQLKEYGEQRKSLTDRADELRKKLSGSEKTDLTALEGQKAALEAKRIDAERTVASLMTKLTRHEDARKEIRNARRKQKQREEYWAVILDLYNCCAGITGGNNRAKLTFEAYVQQYYFKQVVAAANKRLTVLTEGMFTLRCKAEARDRVRQSGLDLDVLDRGTGQWRDVSTLSGGESFLASLALALGLSDVVQAQSGAIRMEAMFIDEGFGTLDDNALRNSLQVLADLAGGKRLIGIISHVHDLEERIEKQIVVSKTLSGSKISMLA